MKTACLMLGLMFLVGCSGTSSNTPPPPPPGNATLPLKASANRRYLVDQNNGPVLLAGDSPHSMLVNLSSSDLATYLANRQNHGINVLWVQAFCTDYIANCRTDLSTYDGIKPFTSGTNEFDYDISTPNPVYWSRVDSYIQTAASYGITIMLDTWETGALMPLARTNGASKMNAFGMFLGNRYKSFPNLIWITGADFQTWTDPNDNALMQSLMSGIAASDVNHLHTTELNFFISGSRDNTLLAPYTTLAGAYDYYCAYTETLDQYNHASPVPVFYEEGYYENNAYILGNTTTALNLRTQSWWVALAGATAGQMYGNELIYPFAAGWQNNLNTVGVRQFGYLNSLLQSIKWYNLVPDQNHVIVTAGYGTPDSSANNTCLYTNDYVTTSYLADGTASLSYTPKSATLTVDMSKFSAAVTAKWYDPSAGTSTAIGGSPFTNAGSQNFSTPGNNAAGDQDWVLVLTTN